MIYCITYWTTYSKKKCSCHGACCKAILGDDYECQVKKYWNKFLNWLIPNRRKKLLIKMMRDAEDMGLYDEPYKRTQS